MLQIIEEDFSPFRSVRMHDVLRELATSIGREQNFCSTHDREEEISTDKARYLSMQNSIVNIQSSSTCHHRSLMLFQTEIPSLSLCSSISSRYKLLRVLYLRASSIESVPYELVELFNLRYLYLSNTNVEALPKSIGRLQNLQTLDIYNKDPAQRSRKVKKIEARVYTVMHRSSGWNIQFELLADFIFHWYNDDAGVWRGYLHGLVPFKTSIMVLRRSHLKKDPLSSLEALSNLRVLRLVMAYVGRELCFRHGCFLKLKI
ncbi:disease resistance protein RPM1-like protein [Cinnamomum micranthum f. kanehirae]|uniref:Disease resistance protein RPM1-like protein n=1 Tax=Cinnamomum micranthum f. kanehirae TaxID=337451 RepID=A0A3S3NRT6_9MAGN|nr:disease resistance protein RPM1-like protein [Cinnamomum micranthum f. kanehirae]